MSTKLRLLRVVGLFFFLNFLMGITLKDMSKFQINFTMGFNEFC